MVSSYQSIHLLYTVLLIILAHFILLIVLPLAQNAAAGQSQNGPSLEDSNLKIEEIAEGLNLPTSISFLGPNDFVVLEKDEGTVKRVIDGEVLERPLLDVSVANENERGMLGIVIQKESDGAIDEDKKTYAYISFTESNEDGSDDCSSSTECEEEGTPLGNRLYKYELNNNHLVNPQLLLDLPATPGPAHNGGALSIGPDNNVYLIIGNVRGLAQNPKGSGGGLDGRAGILRVTPEGGSVGKGILGNDHPLDFYYAYGIRNGFGLDFDPVTGKLWDTENGPGENDEINLVEPGFNSGYEQIQGILTDKENISLLEDFQERGKYSDPEFVWNKVVGPTALVFFDSNAMGEQYENDIFVGDVHRGNIYHFELNDQRTEFILDGPLQDRVANNDNELQGIIFGRNFAGISDMEVGPDGYLYIVSIGLGKVFRIVPDVDK